MINSERWSRARVLPPAMVKPPTTEPITISVPTMTIMRVSRRMVEAGRIFLQQQSFDGQNGLRMNLANARFRHPESLGDFPQAHVFKIVKGKNLALHGGQAADAILDQSGHLARRG